MDPRRRAVAPQPQWPGPAGTDGTDPFALRRQVAILEATCRRHEVTLNALLEATVELRRANLALTAENATLRTRNSVSMVEQVRRTPRGRPRLLFDTERTAS